MIINIILLLIGFGLLVKGADLFVDGASSTAQNFKVPKTLIGLTIIAFGTSIPEFAVSMNALASDSSDMVLGNVIGSCILNILLILGIAAFINPIKIKDNTAKKELPLCMLISTLLVVVFIDIKLDHKLVNQISRSDAIVILLFFIVFIYYLLTLIRQRKQKNDEEETPPFTLKKSFLLIIIGLIGIIIGSELVVKKAIAIANVMGISERVISLTIIAFGTALPELITTIISSKKKEQDLLLGNIIGSNIFNICIVLGIPVAIYGSLTPVSFQAIDLIMLIASSVLLFIFATTKRTITRFEGGLMLLIFAIYYILVFVL